MVAAEDQPRTIISPDGWKLRWSPPGEHMLFNLSQDPLEKRNLYPDNEGSQCVKDLVGRINRWQERTGDPIHVPGA